MAWSEVIGDLAISYTSIQESEQFGLNIGRIVLGKTWLEKENDAISKVYSLCEDDKHDISFVRFPSEFLQSFNSLNIANRELLFAGSLMYWEFVLDPSKKIQFHENEAITSAKELSNIEKKDVFEVIESSFGNYKNHYTANPKLGVSSAANAYASWAKSVLEKNPENIIVFKSNTIIAGVAILAKSDNNSAEILLAGVSNSFQRQGIYTKLIKGVFVEMRKQKIKTIYISTQSQNIPVQRAWAKLGFTPTLSVDTFHSISINL